MGVSGSGKTTIGRNLAERLNLPFYDADDFHSQSNLDKMASGLPLNDKDRKPWLKQLSKHISSCNREQGAVLACSALKESYRTILTSNIDVNWVYLKGSLETIANRLNSRNDHFFDPSLLKTQFDTLEIPIYGLHVEVENNPKDIVESILKHYKSKRHSEFGLIGLGVMGKSLALNILDNGFSLSVYNRSEGSEKYIVSEFISGNQSKDVLGFKDLKSFVLSIERPRKILLMIKAGKPVDHVLDELIPYLESGDIVIDGGNSYYKDTTIRNLRLNEKENHFIGAGISGGETGARFGPSIMPGGSKAAYNQVKNVLESISAKGKSGEPCCTYIGPDGSGHFIKMVHNGIEYAEMQLLAETISLMSLEYGYNEIAEIFTSWNSRELNSYLLEITIDILKKKENGNYILDLILDKAGNKGTGSWSTTEALELGLPNTMMSASVFARFVSTLKEKRARLSKLVSESSNSIENFNLQALMNAYQFARIVNHQQGFELISEASKTNSWDLNLSNIAQIWTNGCIIKSDLMEQCTTIFKTLDDLVDDTELFEVLKSSEADIGVILKLGIDNREPLFCYSAAYNYWIALTTERLSANVIQAQRDYFGAHTYQRIDAPMHKFFHTNW